MKLSERYANWLLRNRLWVLVGSLVLVAASALAASRLHLQADLASLLPPGRRSVQDLKLLEARVRAFGTVFVVVEGDNAERVSQAASQVATRARAVDPALVAQVISDDARVRDYFWTNRFLFASLSELQEARDALDEKTRRAKLAANPLYVDLEESEPQDAKATDDKVNRLLAKVDEAEAKYQAPSKFASADGRTRLVIVRSTAPTTDFTVNGPLFAAMQRIARDVESEVAGVAVGLTGDVTSAVLENASILRGVWTAAAITVFLIGLALLLYYRSVLAVAASLWALTVGMMATFACAFLLIGHLNMITAFLIGIVAGNGINAGLILLSRYFEEVRAGRNEAESLQRAIAGAARATLAASVAAGVAYGALMATDFRGFRHFGVIGSLGMVLCWVAAFTVLPAALCVLRARGRIRAEAVPAMGRLAGWLAPRRPGVAVAAAGFVIAGAVAVTAWYVASGPMEDDWRNLRAENREIRETWRLDAVMREKLDPAFGQGLVMRFVVAVPDRAQVDEVAAKLRAAPKTLIDSVTTLNDLVPRDQVAKIALLREIRELLDEETVAALEPADQKLVARLMPPEHIAQVLEADVPAEIFSPFVEQDGSVGRLIWVAGAKQFNSWITHDRLALARGVRALALPEQAIVGGQSFVVADIIASMAHDGPIASILALVGALLVVAIFVGVGRHGLITAGAGLLGILGMIALCALFGLKVNFLDLVALPITIGIGIDYAVNLAVRDREDPSIRNARELLRTTGGAVFLCSFTTIVGYGSLLLSDNAGIRSFGWAAILGEFACIGAALLLVPALLQVTRKEKQSDEDPGHSGAFPEVAAP